MNEYILNINEPKNYNDRVKNSNITNIAITLILILIISVVSELKYGVIIGVIFFLVQFYKSSRWDKYFITRIKISETNIEIKFKEQNSEHTLEGNLHDFLLKKELAFNKTRTAYLAVYYKSELQLKQFAIGDWNENKFDDVINKTKVKD